MVKTNIVEKMKELLKTDGVKAMSILMSDEEIKNETVGDFNDSIEYAIENYLGKRGTLDNAKELNNDLKTEVNDFVENINGKLLHKKEFEFSLVLIKLMNH